ncbi:MAG: hypothetical protein KA715_04825 [Xanthomonadaceae bacterium]|nr:hypothetical protein [Xanthomonadaceae bacterium]
MVILSLLTLISLNGPAQAFYGDSCSDDLKIVTSRDAQVVWISFLFGNF